jgi:hypothetical protein
MAKFITSKVDLHDRTQIQTVFDYFLAKDSRSNRTQRFDLEIYFFFPPQFNIHPHTYSKEDFYQDIRPLLRLKSPAYSYKDFIGTKEKSSVIDGLLEKILKADSFTKQKKVTEDIRLIGCSLRSYFGNYIDRLIYSARKGTDKDISAEVTLDTLKNTFQVFIKWSSLVEKVSGQKNIHSKLIKEVGLLNEYIVYFLQDNLALLLTMQERKIDHQTPTKIRITRRVRLFGCLLIKYAKRKRINFVNNDSSSRDKESFSMRLSYLKRRVSQVLYLNLKEKKSLFSKSQLAYILAAAFAASWALVANVFIWYKLGSYQKLSDSALGITGVLLLLAFVGSYILKDRLKEYGRTKLQKGMLSFLPDHSEKVWYEDHSGQIHNIGKINEYKEFVSFNSLPHEVIHQREFNLGKKLAEHESIIHYRKSITIDDRKIKKISADISSIQDIIRLNVKRYVSRLEDPMQSFHSFSEKGKVTEVRLPKVYYFDMIFHYSQRLKSGRMLEAAINSKRILLNKKGIVRVV